MWGNWKGLVKGIKSRQKLLNHIAVTLEGNNQDPKYVEKLKITEQELYTRKGRILNALLNVQTELDIPLLTVYLLSSKKVGTGFSVQINNLNLVLNGLDMGFIHKNQIKVSLIGKWYELPSAVLSQVKHLINETRDYDRFFLNLCIYYEGQGEILDACKMIARKVELEKLNADEISKATIKDNLYTSQYLPPELIIINGTPKLGGFLLWDAPGAALHITKKPWPEFSGHMFKEIIEKFMASSVD